MWSGSGRYRYSSSGRPLPPLHGVPVGVKDVLSTREGPTTAQCAALPYRMAGGLLEVLLVTPRGGEIFLGLPEGALGNGVADDKCVACNAGSECPASFDCVDGACEACDASGARPGTWPRGGRTREI